MNNKWEKREINNETLVLHPALLSVKMWCCHELVKSTFFRYCKDTMETIINNIGIQG